LESRPCLERDKGTPESPLSDVSSSVILRGIVRGFTDDVFNAVCEDNIGPEVIRLNERTGRSNLSPEELTTVSRIGYALSEREINERATGEFRDIGDGGFLKS